jgi:hypothetical protein
MAEPVSDTAMQSDQEADEASALALKPPVPVAGTVPDPYPEYELVQGDTPLSAIERLAIPSDLNALPHRRDRLLTAAWAASFAALAAIGVAGYTQRDVLMKQWPASKRVYATLGLAPLDKKAGEAKAAEAPPTAH